MIVAAHDRSRRNVQVAAVRGACTSTTTPAEVQIEDHEMQIEDHECKGMATVQIEDHECNAKDRKDRAPDDTDRMDRMDRTTHDPADGPRRRKRKSIITELLEEDDHRKRKSIITELLSRGLLEEG